MQIPQIGMESALVEGKTKWRVEGFRGWQHPKKPLLKFCAKVEAGKFGLNQVRAKPDWTKPGRLCRSHLFPLAATGSPRNPHSSALRHIPPAPIVPSLGTGFVESRKPRANRPYR